MKYSELIIGMEEGVSEEVEGSIQRISSAAATAAAGGGGGGGGGLSGHAIARRAEKILASVKLIRSAAKAVTQGVEVVTLAVGQINQGEYDRIVRRRFTSGSSLISGAAKKLERGAKGVNREASKILKLASSLSDESAKKT
ncbi:hypothetical protein CBR_g20116 [Chara braunii]|uniref:Uncharacterized protein n=1 Tax=Chara braunii TaxID=69332 RepID=A0A388KZK3_CHABU|nr:hypothetical protein CBR_g20116 [Chara braunii]|eukprot:GBG75485.1 hypothetical protein CBR_g20116 [Chara braunii]